MEKNEEIKQIKEENAGMDYLTGFLNRRGLYEYFERLDESENINFMFLDIDNFKSVNDTYGHAMGDKLLIAVSRMIKSKIGDSVLARIGGDEFVIVTAPGFSEADIEQMAHNIISSINDIDISIEIRSIISFSIGVVLNQKKSMGMDAIMPKCDAAMYEAKRRGKNGYVLYSTIENIFKFKRVVDREKAQALAENHFEVQLIPVMNMASSVLECAKSYVVWKREDEVWPEEKFLNILEEDGFIIELEKYIFRKICCMFAEFPYAKCSKIPVIVSTSAISINHLSFISELEQILKEYDIPANKFIIELENINNRIDNRRIIRFMENLKERGFGTSVKGFGQDSLAIMMMKELKLDYVNVDKRIAENVLNNSRDSLFVKNILSLINDLNIEPIAEGIYNKNQAKYISAYGCRLGSGSYFASPMNIQEYVKFADGNVPDIISSVRFRFNNSLKDETGRYEGKFLGPGQLSFQYDETLGKRVLQLIGGRIFENVVELPCELINSSSYSIVIRFKMESAFDWSSIVYGMYKNGFLSFTPYAWQGLPIYRIKDDLDENGWNDVIGQSINDGRWHIAVLTFSHKNSISRFYLDGKAMGFKDNVPTLAEPRKLIIGGDIYAKSCVGYVDEVRFFDAVLDINDVENQFSV